MAAKEALKRRAGEQFDEAIAILERCPEDAIAQRLEKFSPGERLKLES